MSEVTLLILDLPEWMALGHTLCFLNIPTEKKSSGLKSGECGGQTQSVLDEISL